MVLLIYYFYDFWYLFWYCGGYLLSATKVACLVCNFYNVEEGDPENTPLEPGNIDRYRPLFRRILAKNAGAKIKLPDKREINSCL